MSKATVKLPSTGERPRRCRQKAECVAGQSQRRLLQADWKGVTKWVIKLRSCLGDLSLASMPQTGPVGSAERPFRGSVTSCGSSPLVRNRPSLRDPGRSSG